MVDRPVIIVDLDNVVYDWAQAMAVWLDKNGALRFETEVRTWPTSALYTVSSVYEMSPVELAMEAYSQWAIWDDWNIPKGEFMRLWRLGIEAGEIYAKGPIVEGAREALWRLSDAEWSIFIATSRLTKFGAYDKIVSNTTSWLHKENIPFRELAFTHQKTRIAADAIVDDRADNMSEAAHGQRFLFAAPHNSGATVRRWSWPEIVEELIG